MREKTVTRFACATVTLLCLTGPVVWAAGRAAESTGDADTLLLCHFNETEGDTASDDAKNRNPHTGKIIGRPKWTKGKFGNAIQLNGGADAVDFGPYRDVFGVSPSKTVAAGRVEFWFAPATDIDGKSKMSIIVGCCQAPRFYIAPSGELVVLYVTKSWSAKNIHTLRSGISKWKAGT